MPLNVPLSAYAAAIRISEPFEPVSAPDRASYEHAVHEVATWLIGECRAPKAAGSLPGDDRGLISALLTVRPPAAFPDDIHAALDGLLAYEATARSTARIDRCIDDEAVVADRHAAVGNTALRVWQGDIRHLAVDAIVNAANSQLLGCFRPGHRCIDNAIHDAAGPRLRADCARIMDLQSHEEATGDAKITRAYHLPSRFVLHTVGPIVPSGLVEPHHARALADCYMACLDLAAEISNLQSLAFCGISTGVFGYPRDAAAVVALDTVRRWLAAHPNRFDLVVYNVFSDEDRVAYERAFASGPGEVEQ